MDAFERMKRWVAANAPGVELNPPAGAKEIAGVARAMRLKFPADLKSYLLTNDGQATDSHGFIGNWELLPLASILEAWRFQCKMAREGQFTPGNRNKPTTYVKGLWWNPRWIPLAHSADGDYFCLDTDPNEEGTPGQVILFRHDDVRRPLVARSLGEWFARIADDMESGLHKWVVDGEGYGRFDDEGFMLSSLQDQRGRTQNVKRKT
ncbi:MAG: SMI1/KNR4 family protein [Chloroflexia bacterium]